MARTPSSAPKAALVAVLLAAGIAPLAPAQEQPAQPPAPPPAPAAAPAAPAVDSNLLFVGDWDYGTTGRDTSIGGVWRINYADGRFTGVATRPGQPPSPLGQVTVRDHFRSIQFIVFFNGESYTFWGHLDNPSRISGTLTTRGGISRLQARKRG